MTNIDKGLLLIGVGGVICFIVGRYGSLNKENTKKSYYYISKNLLLAAAMMTPLFIFVFFFRFTGIGKKIMSVSVYNAIAFIWIAVLSFIVGLDGYWKRDRIKNDIFEQISKFQMTAGVMISIFMIAFLLRWHHF